jgi:diacylglycerol kinase family enzyme
MKPQDGYIQYIVNPKSGASSSNDLVREFKEYLIDKGFEVRVNLTESLEHARELATKGAVDYQCVLVVGAGGDGTIREILQGLEGTHKLFMPIPCGTENLLANELGFDLHLHTLINAFEGDCVQSMDLGMINDQCFTSVAGFGFDGAVIHRISQIRTGHISHLSYFWPIWRTFWEHDFPRIKVVVDGKEIFDDRGLVFVGNTSRYAIGLNICKDADYSDGLLDICIFRCHEQAKLIAHSVRVVFKRHTKSKNAIYTQGKSIQVTPAEKTVYCQIDGDPGPELPADMVKANDRITSNQRPEERMNKPFNVGNIRVGTQGDFFIIAGPCVIESEEVCLEVADFLVKLQETSGIKCIFKGSFDKANRTSIDSFRGPGLKKGLAILDGIRTKTGLPILTDVHEASQAAAVGEVVDAMQIPAFLCRQTDLLLACGNTGKPVNIKKGQFVSHTR